MPKGDGLTYEQRFWTKVRKLTRGPLTNGSRCWIWEGGRSGKNYGYFWMDGKTRQAYVVSYEFKYGKRPFGKELDHLCRNPPCVNYDHVEPVTRRVNQLRGPTTVGSINATKTRCPQGHLYDYRPTLQRRGCRRCNRTARIRSYYNHLNQNRERVRRYRRRRFLLSIGRKRITEKDLQPVPKKTHCRYGHPFTHPHPRCKTCYQHEWYQRRKAKHAV